MSLILKLNLFSLSTLGLLSAYFSLQNS